MKTIFSKTTAIENYKPIYQLNDKWYVCFWYNEIFEKDNPVLKGGRYVKSDSLKSTGMCSYSYIVYNSKPTVETIKNDINSLIDSFTTNKIINGFSWNGNKIYLSKENQMNYKANYDLALQSGGANLPIRIKTTKNGNTEYLIFFTIDELSEFYLAINKHINNALENGWAKKDNIDYSVYNV